jgi:hypothetical protein
MSEKKKKSGEKMYGKRIVNPVTGHVSHKPRTHESRGKAGKVPHPVGLSPHSGARKNKLRKALEAREDKIQRATPKKKRLIKGNIHQYLKKLVVK